MALGCGGHNFIDALRFDHRRTAAFAVDHGLNIFLFHRQHALGSGFGWPLLAHDLYERAARLHLSLQFGHDGLISCQSEIAPQRVADHFAQVRHGFFFNGLIAGKNHCFPSAYCNLIRVTSGMAIVPAPGLLDVGLGSRALRPFRGRVFSLRRVEIFAAAIIPGCGLFQSRII